ncbi:MAG: nucleoside triphosphate pyrophosphohydrolase family protein, partial [Candidatus Nomurabacteria bacterium]|nr:nucleoside triphosphate pyrophosphohydrolase family protein [Candidatus Nomurabacteria bacterium]
MTFDEYQAKALTTKIADPSEKVDRAVLALGIAGEAGEVADKYKKILGYFGGEMTDADRDALGKEIGDVLWYLATFADSIGLKLDDLAVQN